MTAMIINRGKRVAASGTRLQWHTTPIADMDLIARNTYRFACVEALNGATGMSDMAGKAARVAVEPSGSERDTMERLDERHGRKSREVPVSEIGVDRIQSLDRDQGRR